MNLELALEILYLVTSLIRGISGGNSDSEGIQQIIVGLIRAAAQAYYQHVGKPIDPSLIEAETSI